MGAVFWLLKHKSLEGMPASSAEIRSQLIAAHPEDTDDTRQPPAPPPEDESLDMQGTLAGNKRRRMVSPRSSVGMPSRSSHPGEVGSLLEATVSCFERLKAYFGDDKAEAASRLRAKQAADRQQLRKATAELHDAEEACDARTREKDAAATRKTRVASNLDGFTRWLQSSLDKTPPPYADESSSGAYNPIDHIHRTINTSRSMMVKQLEAAVAGLELSELAYAQSVRRLEAAAERVKELREAVAQGEQYVQLVEAMERIGELTTPEALLCKS